MQKKIATYDLYMHGEIIASYTSNNHIIHHHQGGSLDMKSQQSSFLHGALLCLHRGQDFLVSLHSNMSIILTFCCIGHTGMFIAYFCYRQFYPSIYLGEWGEYNTCDVMVIAFLMVPWSMSGLRWGLFCVIKLCFCWELVDLHITSSMFGKGFGACLEVMWRLE